MLVNHDFHLVNKGVSNYDESSVLPRHRWYHYKEGFSPNLVDSAINGIGDFDKEKDVIFDPFNGSGTVTLHSSLNGYQSKGFEVNPFSSFVSKVKQINIDDKGINFIKGQIRSIVSESRKGSISPLINFSTFSEFTGKDKWLFNSSVLNSFQGAINQIEKIKNKEIKSILSLACLNSVMENSNAQKDGKCLRYKKDWTTLNYSKDTFIESFQNTLDIYLEDIQDQQILQSAQVTNGDSRKLISETPFTYKICITSPPYLNSFDYTDIYRPELFLGNFVRSPNELLALRKNTIRSHTNLPNSFSSQKTFGYVYDNLINNLTESKLKLWSPKIPSMIQAYFEDMQIVLQQLRKKAAKNAQLWLIVANSAYADIEIPTDLILAEIGGKANWYLKEIGVLRYLHKRGTKYSPNIAKLRESVIIFSTESK